MTPRPLTTDTRRAGLATAAAASAPGTAAGTPAAAARAAAARPFWTALAGAPLRHVRNQASRLLLSVGPLVVAVFLWQVLTANQVHLWLNFTKLPGPAAVLAEFGSQLGSGIYYQNLLASMERILLGFALATVTGVAVGIAIGRSRAAAGALRPLIEVARPISAIALVPLAILLFPTSEQGIVFITYFAAFFPVAVSTIHAMKTLPNVWEEAARTMGAGRCPCCST
jgi:ABC-type nitrate/sulfonate/bicarbonate transport system permease component